MYRSSGKHDKVDTVLYCSELRAGSACNKPKVMTKVLFCHNICNKPLRYLLLHCCRCKARLSRTGIPAIYSWEVKFEASNLSSILKTSEDVEKNSKIPLNGDHAAVIFTWERPPQEFQVDSDGRQQQPPPSSSDGCDPHRVWYEALPRLPAHNSVTTEVLGRRPCSSSAQQYVRVLREKVHKTQGHLMNSDWWVFSVLLRQSIDKRLTSAP